MTTLRSETPRPLIGRSALVAEIANERVCILVAQPGAGKSRLLAELAATAPEAIVATVRCHRGVVSTLEPLETLVETAARRLAGRLQNRAARGTTDDADRLMALRERFEAIAAIAPMLFQIDDVHWVPRATLDAIAFCIDRTRDSAIRWQLATRPLAETPDPLDALRREPDCRIVDVPLLDAAQTAELARVLGGDTAPELHRLTGGNPLYVEQWLLSRSRPGTASTLRSTLELRAREIPDRAAEVAALVAVAERPLTLEEISRALGKERDDVLALVDDLEALGILRSIGAGIEFVHDLLRGACVGSLADSSRAAIREKLVAIARDEFERAERLVAVHRFDEAADAYIAAGRNALAKAAFAESREIANRLRALPALSPSARWQLTAIDATNTSASRGTSMQRPALEAFLAARECVDSETCAFFLERMISVFDSPDEELGSLIIETMLAAGDVAPGDKSAFTIARAKTLYGSGDFAAGLALTEAGLASAELAPDDAFQLRCLRELFRGTEAVSRGRAGLVALAGDTANGSLPSYAFVYHVLAVLEDSCDDNAAVVHWSKLGIANANRAVRSLYYYWAASSVSLGRLSEALDVCEAALGVQLSRGLFHPPSLLTVHVEAHAWTGQFSRAHALLETARSIASVDRVRNGRALLAELQGRPGDALSLFEAAANDLAVGASTHGAIALAGLVRLHSLRGDAVAARTAYDRLTSGTSQTELSWRERAESEFYLALAGTDEAEIRQTYASLERARVPILNRTVALARMGERLRDRDALFEATATFERCGAVLHAERTRRSAQGLGFRFGSKSVSRNALTPREADVARLVAAGRTNREIAEVLHVSPKTVAANIGTMLERYGLRSRVEIAAHVAAGKTFERV